MGKTYIDTLKYVVYGELEITGLVEKPDVVGAIFGQTEGLLGDELDLRDLQKNGKIGRIEVNLSSKKGNTVGDIKLPSSLAMVETCILGAALETVDRVGPYEAHVKVTRVEDTRNMKRKVIVDRAKNLLKNLLNTEIPDSKEISEQVRSEVKTAEITKYGKDKLDSGPHLDRFNDVIFVEGRADVLNLLKNDVPNIVAIGGATVNDTLIQLSKEKETTLFLDGDRGGDLILNQLSKVADIDFVARAPRGKEVEELTRKELIKCLRNKMPYDQKEDIIDSPYVPDKQSHKSNYKEKYTAKKRTPAKVEPKQYKPAAVKQPDTRKVAVKVEHVKTPTKTLYSAKENKMPAKYSKSLTELENTLRARFYDSKDKCVKEMPVRDLIKNLEKESSITTIVFDGIITQRLVDLAQNKKTKRVVGIRKGNIHKAPDNLELMTKD